MDGLERFQILETLATEFFDSSRWKTAFCRRYDLTPQTITSWANKGAPVWAVQAMADAVTVKKVQTARTALADILKDL